MSGKLVAIQGACISCPKAVSPGASGGPSGGGSGGGFANKLIGTSDPETCATDETILTENDSRVGTNIFPFPGCTATPTGSCRPLPKIAAYSYFASPWKNTAEPFADIEEKILTEGSFFECIYGDTKVTITKAGQDGLTVMDLYLCDEEMMTDEFFNDLLAFLADQGIVVDQQKFFNDPEYFKFFFTFSQEIGYRQFSSIEPHWPGGASGVTIGPGYDLKHRTQQQVYDDLVAAGVDPAIAQALSQGAGLSGDTAKNFANNWNLGDISRDEEVNLFQFIIPEYIDRSRNAIDAKYGAGIWNSLDPVQQAMLFDIEYNGGIRNYPTFTDAVLSENWQVACVEHVRNSNGQPLGKRTDDFEDLFCEHV